MSFFLRNLNGNLIFRDKNGNTFLSISCLQTRTRNRKWFLKVEREQIRLILTGIPGNGNSRHSLVSSKEKLFFSFFIYMYCIYLFTQQDISKIIKTLLLRIFGLFSCVHTLSPYIYICKYYEFTKPHHWWHQLRPIGVLRDQTFSSNMSCFSSNPTPRIHDSCCCSCSCSSEKSPVLWF